MIAKTCTRCGRRFVVKDDEDWKKTCLPCWKAEKNKTSSGSSSRSTADWLNERMRQPAQPIIDPVMVKRLLQLCHPDKHGGSQASLTATQWLLTLK